MPASVQTPADLVNITLARIGFKGRIGSLYDGSAVAKKALDIYAQTRDEYLRQNDFDFAERNTSMTLLKSAPAGGYFPPAAWNGAVNPSVPWFFEYAYPADCLKVRSIKGVPLFVIDFDPQPVSYSVENDAFLSPPAKVILCNIPNAVLTYTGQITDLTSWEADSIEAFAAALGRRLAPSIMGMDAAKLAAADESASFQIAEKEQG